ncbi:MAG TPA: hypothetical protein HA349_01430 [Methanotrichaceae archaeon]|nr:hypothetical protein [Methanotrichaceae archaeon]
MVTIIATIFTLLHHGCVLVGLPYSFSEQMTFEEITGGSPRGASSITGGRGGRMPSVGELKMMRRFGAHLNGIARKLAEGRGGGRAGGRQGSFSAPSGVGRQVQLEFS